ncbi:CFS_G0006590.mRNA.1.CDS.1 [Saccharomyces cerevisiae]|nr:CFS_G0006590.mRNA.1.CDS.1 [Saccharomyces cerevisiae]CAI7175073.1 CFS_G0006590.mRNA.1.CDS.1 [Saccharomyces cerevisiae]
MPMNNFLDEFNLFDSIITMMKNDPCCVEDYESIVENLNRIFQRTFNDEEHRKSMANSPAFLGTIKRHLGSNAVASVVK